MTAQFSSASAVERPDAAAPRHAARAEPRSGNRTGRLEPLRLQCRGDRVFVDDAVAREVEQHRARLHGREAIGVEQVARHCQQRHVQRHEVGLLEQLLDAVRAADACGQPPRGVDR
jgi:hypothetical protein